MKHSIELTPTDLRILRMIAFSSTSYSAYEISSTFGENSYSHVHKSCRKMVEMDLLKSDEMTNERNAPKKVFRLSLWGFCCVMNHVYKEMKSCHQRSEMDDILDKLILLMRQWKHLHDGIECYAALFTKIEELDQNPFDAMQGLVEVCNRAVLTHFLYKQHMTEKNIDITNSVFGEDHFLGILILTVLTIPGKTKYMISFDDIIEIFKNSSAIDILKELMEEQIKEGELINQSYKKYFRS